jgi:GntR family transcriptional regulator
MRLGPGVPVVTVERVTRDQDGLPVELLRVVAAGDRTELVYDDLPLAPGTGRSTTWP